VRVADLVGTVVLAIKGAIGAMRSNQFNATEVWLARCLVVAKPWKVYKLEAVFIAILSS
jgi:hypothetical protein